MSPHLMGPIATRDWGDSPRQLSVASEKLFARPLSPTISVTNYFYIEDNNSTGTAGTTLNAATAVLASPNLATNTVAFGNFRLGSTLSSNVFLTNNNLPTANNYSEALAGKSTTSGGATVSGLPTVAAPLAQGAVATLTVGLPSNTAGPVSGNVNFAFTSEKGSSVSPGPSARPSARPRSPSAARAIARPRPASARPARRSASSTSEPRTSPARSRSPIRRRPASTARGSLPPRPRRAAEPRSCPACPRTAARWPPARTRP